MQISKDMPNSTLQQGETWQLHARYTLVAQQALNMQFLQCCYYTTSI